MTDTRRSRFLLSEAILFAAVMGTMLLLCARGISSPAVWKAAGVAAAALTGGALLLDRPLKPERLFVYLMTGFGLFYIFIITPMSAPDETAHLNAAMTLSGTILRTGTVCDSAYLSAAGLTGHENTLEAFTTLTQGLFTEGLTGVPAGFPAFVFTYPLMYLPQTAGVLVARLLGLNRLWIYVLGDLTNWLFYTALIALAIRITPRGKLLMAFSALLPMSLQLCTSMSPDAFVTAMSYLLIALIIRAAEGEKRRLTIKEMAAIVVVGMFLSPAKAVYFLLLLLVFLIPKDRFGGMKGKLLFAAAALGCAFIFTMIIQLPVYLRSAPAQAEGTSSFYSISWILTHIPQTAVMFIKTLLPSGIFDLIESTIGTQLSGFTLIMVNGYLYAMLFIMLLQALCSHENELMPTVPERVGFLGISFLILLAVMGTMLLNWTEVGEILIQGVQGRYLIPVLPLVLMAIQTKTFIVRRDMTLIYAFGFTLCEWLCVNHILGHFA